MIYCKPLTIKSHRWHCKGKYVLCENILINVAICNVKVISEAPQGHVSETYRRNSAFATLLFSRVSIHFLCFIKNLKMEVELSVCDSTHRKIHTWALRHHLTHTPSTLVHFGVSNGTCLCSSHNQLKLWGLLSCSTCVGGRQIKLSQAGQRLFSEHRCLRWGTRAV